MSCLSLLPSQGEGGRSGVADVTSKEYLIGKESLIGKKSLTGVGSSQGGCAADTRDGSSFCSSRQRISREQGVPVRR